MDDKIQRQEIADFLRRLKRAYEDAKHTDITDAAFSGLIGIAPSVWNGYKKQHNVPLQENAQRIGEWVGNYLGAEQRDLFLTVCGHSPKVREITDDRLLYIVDEWENDRISETSRGLIYEQIREPKTASP